eukprot:TRINITY_DN103509_c0_g1_i1.p1 TRINITY_DN103509_c0_g1~~TRINITY_DN103509_c0_g1_i1.p1  ORF type:complete len:188 (+),score=12.07 TRINITY_DN103509_c0_g1_i1:109-672(+)
MSGTVLLPDLVEGQQAMSGTQKVSKAVLFGSIPLVYLYISFAQSGDLVSLLYTVAAFGVAHGLRHIFCRSKPCDNPSLHPGAGPTSPTQRNLMSEFFEIEAGGANLAYAFASLFVVRSHSAGCPTGDVDTLCRDSEVSLLLATKTVIAFMVTYFLVAAGAQLAFGKWQIAIATTCLVAAFSSAFFVL